MKNQVQLITYVDRLTGGGLRELRALLDGPLDGVFGGAHLLPFFYPINGADAGFDPIDHTQVDPQLGIWEDVRALGENVELMADLIVNHVSRDSPQFQDLVHRGMESQYAGLFLTLDHVFPEGAKERDLLGIYRPRPGLPFTPIKLDSGETRLFWTTFTPQQIDIDVQDPEGQAYLGAILARFREAGVRAIRLDAAGYAIKKARTTCFMIPETFAFIGELTRQARALGMEALVEIHSYYRQQVEIARHVDWVYDFALPPLVLHALLKADSAPLKRWLEISPRNAITVLDTHDGIGVIDVGADAADPHGRPGLLEPEQIDELVESIHALSGGQSRQATGAAASNLDLYQVNCTFYDALGRDDGKYLLARAIQFFAPGIPQVYYTGLLAGKNDMDLLAKTSVGRDINRRYYQPDEVLVELARPVVRGLIDLIRFRNSHEAFGGRLELGDCSSEMLILTWRNGGHWARLEADLQRSNGSITCSGAQGLTIGAGRVEATR